MPEQVTLKKQYTALIDVGTLLFHSALAGQQTNFIVTHKSTGREVKIEREIEVLESNILDTDVRIDMSEGIDGDILWKVKRRCRFKNKTEFYGGFRNEKIGGWLATLNEERLEKGQSTFEKSDFELKEEIELVPDHEMIVKGRLKQKIAAIENQPWCNDIIIGVSSGKNFREELAQTQEYKAGRKDKPLCFDIAHSYLLYKFKDKIVFSHNDEDESIICYLAQQDWIQARGNVDKLKYVVAAIDKDLGSVPQLHYNYDHPERGVELIKSFEACYNFCRQCLRGDGTDGIMGLGSLPKEYLKEKGLRVTKGVGEKTVTELLKDCNTQKELFEKVVECYKVTYGEEKVDFTTWRGDVVQRDWLDHLTEQAALLRMYADPANPIYDIKVTLKKMEIL